jgi:hypothetical protein
MSHANLKNFKEKENEEQKSKSDVSGNATELLLRFETLFLGGSHGILSSGICLGFSFTGVQAIHLDFLVNGVSGVLAGVTSE